VSQFGRTLRRERKDRGMTLLELAKQLKISVPYLSQIETGAKPLQDGFVERVIQKLGFIGEEANALRRAAAVSMSEFNIRLASGASKEDRVFASELATGFARLSPEAKARIREIMKADTRG
jgi:transcriptional regulator with XRE-family HTH domain